MAQTDAEGRRKEQRRPGLRLAEYTPVPRSPGDEVAGSDTRHALALDYSANGIRIDTDERLRIGSLVRITVCEINGEAEALSNRAARVAWRSPSPRQVGRYTAGLELIDNEEIRVVPIAHVGERRKIAVSA